MLVFLFRTLTSQKTTIKFLTSNDSLIVFSLWVPLGSILICLIFGGAPSSIFVWGTPGFTFFLLVSLFLEDVQPPEAPGSPPPMGQ